MRRDHLDAGIEVVDPLCTGIRSCLPLTLYSVRSQWIQKYKAPFKGTQKCTNVLLLLDLANGTILELDNSTQSQ